MWQVCMLLQKQLSSCAYAKGKSKCSTYPRLCGSWFYPFIFVPADQSILYNTQKEVYQSIGWSFSRTKSGWIVWTIGLRTACWTAWVVWVHLLTVFTFSLPLTYINKHGSGGRVHFMVHATLLKAQVSTWHALFFFAGFLCAQRATLANTPAKNPIKKPFMLGCVSFIERLDVVSRKGVQIVFDCSIEFEAVLTLFTLWWKLDQMNAADIGRELLPLGSANKYCSITEKQAVLQLCWPLRGCKQVTCLCPCKSSCAKNCSYVNRKRNSWSNTRHCRLECPCTSYPTHNSRSLGVVTNPICLLQVYLKHNSQWPIWTSETSGFFT